MSPPRTYAELGPGVHPVLVEARAQIVRRLETKKQLEIRAGLSHGLIDRWFAGKSRPNIYDVDCLLGVLGLELCTRPSTKHVARPTGRLHSPGWTTCHRIARRRSDIDDRDPV